MTPDYREGFNDGHAMGKAAKETGHPGFSPMDMWPSSNAKDRQDAIAADLDKLTDPRPGTRVEGEGFCYVRNHPGCLSCFVSVNGRRADDAGWSPCIDDATMRALVEGGKATVTVPEEENND